MKKVFLLGIIGLLGFAPLQHAVAQAQELEQLVLNIEKLLQFRKILSDMKEGYELLTQGYNAVAAISEGNFNLHKVFLDGLLEVSPTVKKYQRIGQIIELQIQLVKEYQAAYHRFVSSTYFSLDELDYLQRVYAQLLEQSVNAISDLTMILTAGQLRMSDDERLQAIDTLYMDMREQITFLRHFNNNNSLLLAQRIQEGNAVKEIKKMYEK